MNSPEAIITPLTAEQQQQVIDKTHFYIRRASEIYDFKNDSLSIQFNLKGRSVGMYRVKRNRKLVYKDQHREIRYNPLIFSKYFNDNLITTVPHEVAHYVSDLVYGLENIKPHGKEWQEIMRFFGADSSVTANYDLSGIPLKKQTYFKYRCACSEHQLTSIRHNRVKKYSYQYLCNNCKQVLQHEN